MKEKLLSCALIVAMLFGLASCGAIKSKKTISNNNAESEQQTEETTTEETTEKSTTEDDTEAEETSAVETSIRETSTTAESTESLTQRVTEIITTAVNTTSRVATSINYTGATTTETKTYVSDLKYGVDKRRTVKITYGYDSNGKKIVVSEEETKVVYDRSTYSASYSDLLPAAKQNRQTYASYINEVLRLTNEMRAEGGLAPLTLNEGLTEQANVRAEEVAWAGATAHGHIRPNTRSYTSIFKENGFTSGLVGENVGWYYTTPSAVCAAWKASTTHYENIMNPDFKSIGIGVAAEADPTLGLVWVQHFYS